MDPSEALLTATFKGISNICAEDRITCPECKSRQNEHIKWDFYRMTLNTIEFIRLTSFLST